MRNVDYMTLFGGCVNMCNMIVRGPRWIPAVSGIIMTLAMSVHLFGWFN